MHQLACQHATCSSVPMHQLFLTNYCKAMQPMGCNIPFTLGHTGQVLWSQCLSAADGF